MMQATGNEGDDPMRLDKPRLTPLAPEEWDDEARELLEPLTGGAGPNGKPGRVLNIFATLARHPKLAKRWLVFGNHVLGKNTLSPRDRELVILRIGWLCQAEYEWGQHAVIARASDITDEEIRRTTEGPDAPGWKPNEVALMRATDELHADAFVSDETWAALAQHYGEQQLIDLVFTVGQYNLVSMALNTLGVQLDEGIAGFPDGVARR
jgi:alkylhydroperoxidase family enzyme